jgi:hypothetical protein
MSTLSWQIASCSVRGREHTVSGRNNQDARCWRSTEEALVAVVCDGCGSGLYSETGAQLGASLVTESILCRRTGDRDHTAILEETRERLLDRLDSLARSMAGDYLQILHDYFLFTIVGVLVTRSLTSIFSIGDGLAVVNGNRIPLGPFPDNQPPYAAYGLLAAETSREPVDASFQIHRCLPTQDLNSVLIATDGLMDWLNMEDKLIPGKKESVGPLSQFWCQDSYFSNHDSLRRKLAVVNREYTGLERTTGRAVRKWGLLKDDTTLVVIRRR